MISQIYQTTKPMKHKTIKLLPLLIFLFTITTSFGQKTLSNIVGLNSFVLLNYQAVPNAPDNLRASGIFEDKINIEWQDNSNNESNFRVEMSTGNNQNFSQVANIFLDNQSYLASGLTIGQTYYFRVRAYNSSGYSSYSNEISVTIPTRPAAAGGFMAAYQANNQVKLNWTYANNDADHFIIERWTNNQDKTLLATLGKDAREFYDDTFANNQTYYYGIKAIKNNIGSNPSVASVAVPNIPPPPYNIKATRTTDAKVSVTWEATGNNTGFFLEKSLKKASGFTLVKTLGRSERSFIDADVQPNTTYFYRIRANSTQGMSMYSVVAQASSVWGNWQAKKAFTTKKYPPRVIGATAGKHGYIFNPYDSLWIYNPALDTWTGKKHDKKISSNFLFSHTIKGKIYLLSEHSSIYEYDPVNDTWETKQAAPHRFSESTIAPFAFNNKIYYAYSKLENNERASIIMMYDPADNSWAEADKIPGHTWYIGSFVVGEYAYFIRKEPLFGQDLYHFDRYDVINKELTNMGNFPSDISADSKFFSHNDKAFVLTKTNLYCYLPQLNEWKTMPALVNENPLAYDFGFLIQGKIYTGPHESKTWEFTPDDDNIAGYSPQMTDLTLENATQTKLTWADNTDSETGFSIFRKEGFAGEFKELAQVGTNITTYTDNTVKTGRAYFYRVRAVENTKASMFSNVLFILNQGIPPTPQKLTATLNGFIKKEIFSHKAIVGLQWEDHSDDEQNFEIERSIGDNQNFLKIATVHRNITRYTDAFNIEHTSVPHVYYRVRAVNSSGNSAYSDEYLIITEGDQGGKWIKKQSLPTGGIGSYFYPSDHLSAGHSLHNKGYTLYDRWVMEYDPQTNLWVNKKEFPGGNREGAIGFAINNKGYIGFSNGVVSGNNNSRDLWEHAGGGNLSWSKKSDGPEKFGWAPKAIVRNNLYVAYNHNTNLSILHKYDPVHSQWLQETTCPGAGRAMFAVGDNIYVVTTEPARQLWVYNVLQKHWTRRKDFPDEVRENAVTFTIGNKGYVAMGGSKSKPSGNVWQYDTKRNSWQRVDDGPVRTKATSFVINGIAYVTGGYAPYHSEASPELYAYVPGINPPKNLIATPQTTQITLHWEDVSDEESYFKVERAVGQPNNFSEIAVTGANVESFTDVNVQAGQTYFYRVSVKKEEMISFSNLAKTVITIDATLNAPSGLAVQSTDSHQVTLQWTDNASNETGYEVYRATASGTFAKTGEVNANVSTYQDTNVQPKTVYRYKVLAKNNAGTSLFSNKVTTTTPDGIPLAPGQLNLFFLSETKVSLTWSDRSNNEDVFEVYRAGSSNVFTKIGETAKNQTFFDDNNLTESVYVYRVVAKNNTGSSVPSNELTVHIISVPETPGTLKALAVSQTSIKINWVDKSSNEETFVIYRAQSYSGSYSKIGEVNANVVTFTDQSLQANTSYYYKVQAKNTWGGSRLSNIAQARTLIAPPSAPSNLTVVALSSSSIRLNWNDNSNNEFIFDIYRSLTPNTGFSKVGAVNANVTTYTNNNLSPGTTYYYKVGAKGNTGLLAFSNEANISTLQSAPAAPHTLQATNISASKVSLQWVDNSHNEDKFEIYRLVPSSGGDFSKIAEVNANITTYQDQTLQANTAYYYKVLATNATGNSVFSNIILVQAPPATPLAPENLTILALSDNSLKLDWTDKANNETGFEIHRSLTAGSGFSKVGTVQANITTYTDNSLTSNTTYYYKVLAKNSTVLSASSNEANGKTLLSIPIAPNNLSASDTQADKVTLQWTDKSSGETTFEIYRTETSANSLTKIGEVQANITTFIDAGVLPNTSYTYAVLARNSAGTSPYSNTVQVLTLKSTLATPTNLTVTEIKGDEVSFSWQDNSDNEEAFEVYRSTSSGTGFVSVGNTNANQVTFTDKGLKENQAYYYKVRATSQNGLSAFSPELVTQTIDKQPDNPSNITLTAVAGAVKMVWQDNASTETGFAIYRSESDPTKRIIDKMSKIAEVSANNNSFTDRNTKPHITYYYTVLAFNASNQPIGDNAEVVQVTSLPFLPASPGSLKAQRKTSAEVILTWSDESDNETGFVVERSSDGNNFAEIQTIDANSSGFTDSGLEATQRYYYRVKAINAAGASDYSLVAEADLITGIVSPGTITAKLGPNPTSDVLSISFYLQKREKTQIRLMNNKGKVVLTKDLGTQQGQVETILRLSNLLPGIYMCQVITTSGHTTYKVFKR